jgi:uncharacterized protein YdeI (YjbR/CyaY-like superfamily)
MSQSKIQPPTGGATFASQALWAAWLDTNHETSAGVWLQLARKGAAARSVTYAEAVEAALCYGWIDGQKRALDASAWLQRFAPRSPSSIWSRVNREKAEALIRAGRMHAAGLAAVARAKRNGRWQGAYDSPSRASVPDDLRTALDGNDRASAFFATLDARNRYAILFRVQTAKKPETRARRVRDFTAMLARREKLYP